MLDSSQSGVPQREIMETSSNVARPLHVLIVDRDEDTCGTLKGFFVSQGYTVSCAREPVEALELVKSEVPDAVFSSLVFTSMHGFDFCRRLRALPDTAKSFIVAITVLSSDSVEETILDAGFDRYLLKPINLVFLRSLLETLEKPSL